MVYKRLGVIVTLLFMVSGIDAMEKTLQDFAAETILHGDEELLAQVEGKEYGLPRKCRAFVRAKHLKENLAMFWRTIPVVIPLLKALDNNHLQEVSFLGTSSYALASTKKGRLFWWNTEQIAYDQGNVVPLFFRDSGHDELSCMAVSNDGAYVATAGNSCIKVWTADENFTCIATFENTGVVCTLSFNQSATELVAGDLQGIIRIWSIENPEKTVEILPAIVHFNTNDIFTTFNRVLAARLRADGKTLLTAGYMMHAGNIKPIIRIIDRSLGESTLEIPLACRSPILGNVSFIDDTQALTSFTNGEVFLTDVAKGTTDKIVFKGLHNEHCQKSVLSDDGRYLLTAGRGKVILWERKIQEYEKVREFKGNEPLMNKCAFRSDQAVFLMGSSLKGIAFANLSLWSIEQPYRALTLLQARNVLKKMQYEEGSVVPQEDTQEGVPLNA